MRPTIFFGGESRERLVSVASAQAVAAALPDADLWFWTPDDEVFAATRDALLGHQRPFEVDFVADGERIGTVAKALDRAGAEQRVLVPAMHGGAAENGWLGRECERRGVAFVGSGSEASRVALDKIAAKQVAADVGLQVPVTVDLSAAGAMLEAGQRLVAKPNVDGSSYGLIFANLPDDLAALEDAAAREPYLIELRVDGVEATCGVIERGGEAIALPPVEIRAAGDVFDYASKYLSKETLEICPAGFPDHVNAKLQAGALAAHKALGARGYSRSDFFVVGEDVVFLELNTLPGLTASSLLPKALAAAGIPFEVFLREQIAIAEAARAA
jgi:D-alanine-D-alanine ligase